MSSLASPRTKPLGLPRSIRATALVLLACLIASCTTPPATQQSPQEAPSASADSPGEAHDVFIDRVAEFLDALDAPPIGSRMDNGCGAGLATRLPHRRV